jgi:hypothetical protein
MRSRSKRSRIATRSAVRWYIGGSLGAYSQLLAVVKCAENEISEVRAEQCSSALFERCYGGGCSLCEHFLLKLIPSVVMKPGLNPMCLGLGSFSDCSSSALLLGLSASITIN